MIYILYCDTLFYNVRRTQLVTSGVRVRPVGRRLRGSNLGRTLRAVAVGRHVLLPQPAACVPSACQTERQGKVQSHVLGKQPRQLRVSGTIAVSVGPAVSLLITSSSSSLSPSRNTYLLSLLLM